MTEAVLVLPRGSAATAVLATGCSSTGNQENLGEARQNIFNGGDGKAGADTHVQIATIEIPIGHCTGALIASDTILTAAHCLNDNNEPFGAFNMVAVTNDFANKTSNYTVHFPNLSGTARDTFNAVVKPEKGALDVGVPAVTTLIPYPSFTFNGDAAHDLALLRIDPPIPRAVMAPLGIESSAWLPSTYTGYTALFLGTGASTSDCTGTPGAMKYLEIPVNSISSSAYNFFWGGSSKTCFGDSGGPFMTSSALNSGHALAALDNTIFSVESVNQSGIDKGPELSGTTIRPWLVSNGSDHDGDGVEAPSDNCDAVQNASQLDSDGDGDGDACDLCPGETDTDADGDGLLDCEDPCPSQPNTDADQNGVPDCIDPCYPNDFDTDKDGVCNQKDNCPDMPNSQANANRRAEDYFQLEHLGDRCEPVPVPDGNPVETIVDDPNPTPCVDPQCPGLDAGDNAYIQCGGFFYNEFAIRPMRSQSKTDPTHFMEVDQVPLKTRFCEQTTMGMTGCAGYVGPLLINAADCAAGCAKPETDATLFHRVSFSSGGPSDPEASPPVDFKYFETFKAGQYVVLPPVPLDWTWDYQADFARWTAANQITNVASAADLVGAFLFHATTGQGNDSTQPEYYHGNVDTAGGDLANHFVTRNDGKDDLMDAQGHYTPEGPHACYKCLYFQIQSYMDPVGGPAGSPPPTPPKPYIHWPSSATAGSFHRLGAQIGETSVVLEGAPNTFASIRTVSGNCNGEIDSDRVSAALQTSLGGGHWWIRAAEPLWEQANDSTTALSVALSVSSTGADIVDTAWSDGTTLMSDADRPLTRGSSANPPPITNFAPVFSRYHRKVFLVGGQNVRYQADSGFIYYRLLDESIWQVLNTTYHPHTVLTATMSYVDDALYLLDEISDPAGGTTRNLVRIDTGSGAATTLGSWPKQSAWDVQYLDLDVDGGLLLTSSSTSLQSFAVTRIDLRDPSGITVAGQYTGSAALIMRLVIDRSGYTLVHRRVRTTSSEITPERFTTLPMSAATWTDVGSHL